MHFSTILQWFLIIYAKMFFTESYKEFKKLYEFNLIMVLRISDTIVLSSMIFCKLIFCRIILTSELIGKRPKKCETLF